MDRDKMTFATHLSNAQAIPGHVQAALSVVLGLAAGASVLLDLPLQWKILLVGIIGVAALLAMVKQPSRFVLTTLAFVMPLSLGKSLLSVDNLALPIPSVGIQVYDLLTVVLLIFLLVRQSPRRQNFRFFVSTSLPALVWLLAGFLSLENAKDLQVSSIALITIAKLFALYLVVANSIRNTQDIKWIIGGLLLALAFESMLGVYQGVTGRYAGFSFLGEATEVIQYSLANNSANRCQGTVCHPNALSMYLNTTLPFAMALMFASTRKLHKILTAALIGVGVLALVLTLSRGGWIGFVVIVCIVFVMAIRLGRIRHGTAVLIGCGALLFLTAILMTGPNLVNKRLTASDRGSAQSRIPMAEGALAIMRDYPLLGAGINNYTLYMQTYDPATYYENRGLYQVHNVFLLIGAETGLLGLAAFTWFLLSVLAQAWRMLKEGPNDTVWIVGVGILCGYAALGAHGLVDFALIGCPRVFAQFWFLAGLVVAVAHMTGPGLTTVARSKEDPSQSL